MELLGGHMRRAQRIRFTAAGAIATCAWLGLGTAAFTLWQKAEAPDAPAGSLLWPALEAASLAALVFWVVAGIAYGIVRWIVTGRGPRA